MKHLYPLLFILLTTSLYAQKERGHWYLSGNTAAEFSSQSSDLGESAYVPQNVFRRLDGFQANSFRSGYFITNRLLVGSRVSFLSTDNRVFRQSFDALVFKPFVRYYLFDGLSAKTSFFGEVGFGTIGFGDVDRYETDFHLGIGAERDLAPGILATANLNYDANAEGLNYTNLTLGLNVLTGRLAPTTTASPLAAGTFTASGQLLQMAYGRFRSGGDTESDFDLNLSPRVGYFVLNGLLIEGVVDFRHSNYSFGFTPGQNIRGGKARTNALDLSLQARYYILQRGRLLPFAAAGVGYVSLSERFSGEDYEVKTAISAIPYRLAVGTSYLLSPQLSIDLSAEYNRGRAEPEGQDFSGITSSQRQVQVLVGLRFYLVRAKP